MPTPQTVILIGDLASCHRLEQQLALLNPCPISLGWIIHDPLHSSNSSASHSASVACIESSVSQRESTSEISAPPILGNLADLEAVIARRTPAAALLSFPSAMKQLITNVRTRLRKLRVQDRFFPALEDLLNGVGPRTHVDINLSELIDRPPRALEIDSIRSIITGKTVLLTGAGGSIGSEIARIVTQFEPGRLILIDRSENALFEIDRQIARLRPEMPRKAILWDVVDDSGTLEIFRDCAPQVVFHAAAHKHVPMMEDHPGAAIDNNLFGTMSVANAADLVGCERMVVISTDKAVNPSSIMGATKRLAELYVQNLSARSDTHFAIVRFGNVLGSSGSVLDIWSREIAEGGPLTITDPRMTRYFMTIPEAASLVIQAGAIIDEDAPSCEVFLLDMGEPVKIVDLACRFVQQHALEPILPSDNGHFGQNSSSEKIPGAIKIVYAGARPGEKLHEQLAFEAEFMRPTRHPDINIWVLSPPDDRYIQQMLHELHPLNRQQNPAALAKAIRRILPEMSQPVAA
ncbi:MAG TPA: polysaccharide biosynthesis protein [Phycisphaerales bacterium]|nr:polysaccharide biosynthesis protein [Phycisphaerales bacterium]